MAIVRTFGTQTLVLALVTGLMVIGCQSTEDKNRYKADAEAPPVVDPKYSLSADRQAIEALRGDVPVDRKAENDEEAFLLQLFSEVKRPPSEIRSTFDQMLRKKRELLDRDLKREREVFNRSEKQSRDAFLKDMASARNGLKSKKLSKDERDDFFKDQDVQRKDYFANERDRRNDFESQIREKRKNFEDYSRSKTNEFNAEYRVYQKKFDDLKKQKAEEARKPKATPTPAPN